MELQMPDLSMTRSTLAKSKNWLISRLLAQCALKTVMSYVVIKLAACTESPDRLH